MNIKQVLFVLTFGSALIFAFLHWQDTKRKPPEKECSEVTNIDSIYYRGGEITLANGKKIKVGQPTEKITVGYEFCYKK